MAEIIQVTRTGVTYAAIESTFGARAGTPVRLYPEMSVGPNFQFTQDSIRLSDERGTKFAHQKPARGAKSGAGKLSFRVKPAGTQLLAAATPATPPQGIFPKALWGGEFSGAGSTVASAASGTSITVASGHGSRFAVGCWIAVGVAGVLYPAKVTAISTDTLTLYPALPGTPAASQLVVNGYTYYPTQSNTQSLTVQIGGIAASAPSNYDQQWELLGATGDLSLTLEPGKVAMMDADLRAATWNGPDVAIGNLPAAAASDTMGAPIVFNGSTLNYLQAIATTTRVHVPMLKVESKFNGGMIHLPEYGGVEGRTGVERVGGDYCFGEATLSKRYDPDFDGYWTADTTLWSCTIQQFGSGTTARFLVVEFPSIVFAQRPERMDADGLLALKGTGEFLEDTTISSPTTDLARAPCRMAWI